MDPAQQLPVHKNAVPDTDIEAKSIVDGSASASATHGRLEQLQREHGVGSVRSSLTKADREP